MPTNWQVCSLVVWQSRDGSRPGLACSGGHAWRGAVEHRPIGAVAAAPSAAGLLALRTGHLLEEAVGALTGAL
ncbi:MAG TPA: hypothetical protein VI074_02455 [Propionibacteriaceae bacterium]